MEKTLVAKLSHTKLMQSQVVRELARVTSTETFTRSLHQSPKSPTAAGLKMRFVNGGSPVAKKVVPRVAPEM